MATLAQLETAVFAVLRDDQKSFVLNSEVDTWLNESYLDLAARLRLTVKEKTGTTAADGTIALGTDAADFIELRWLKVTPSSGSTAEERLTYVDDDVYDSYKDTETVPGTDIFRIFAGKIETYPVQVSRPYRMRYVFKPTALSAGADVPAIPEELHIRLINYARAQAKWKEGDSLEGDRYFAFYERGLPDAPRASRRERPGPFSMVPVPGVFDEGE